MGVVGWLVMGRIIFLSQKNREAESNRKSKKQQKNNVINQSIKLLSKVLLKQSKSRKTNISYNATGEYNRLVQRLFEEYEKKNRNSFDDHPFPDARVAFRSPSKSCRGWC